MTGSTHGGALGDLAQVEGADVFAIAEFGGLDIMHNNALWSGGGPVHTISPEDWDRSMHPPSPGRRSSSTVV